jgi:hypothetical protein
VFTKSDQSPTTLESKMTRTVSAIPNPHPVAFLRAAPPTSPTYVQGRSQAKEEEGGMVARPFCEVRAARDVPAGSLWAFLEHRTMAEVMLDEAKNRQASAEEAA